MARTLSADLITEQKATSNTPYIRVYVNSTDYWTRLLYLEHHEEAYRDYAIIVLRNDDDALDIGTLDLTGKELDISYGHVTGNAVAEPDGNNDTAEYSKAATLWVKNQQNVSMEGKKTCQLYCEGMWGYMREQRVMLAGASAPYYDLQSTTLTPYDLMEDIIEDSMGWTLNALPATDDGIIDTFTPTFDMNEMPYETAAAVLYRLIWMTKCYLRAKASKIWEVVYPQDADAVNQTYHSDQTHYFYEYVEKSNVIVPNSIAVYANQDADGGWDSIVTGTASDSDHISKYTTVLQPFLAATITGQTDADNRAAAVLSKIQSEQLAGRLLVPHDASVELYDRVKIHDARSE